MIYYCDECGSGFYDHKNVYFIIKNNKDETMLCLNCFLEANEHFIKVNNPIKHYDPELDGFIKGDSDKRKDINDLLSRPYIKNNFADELKKQFKKRCINVEDLPNDPTTDAIQN